MKETKQTMGGKDINQGNSNPENISLRLGEHDSIGLHLGDELVHIKMHGAHPKKGALMEINGKKKTFLLNRKYSFGTKHIRIQDIISSGTIIKSNSISLRVHCAQ